MTTTAQHRAEAGALTITVAVETQLFRWAAEVDRLKGLNGLLVEALEGLVEALVSMGLSNMPGDTHADLRHRAKEARVALDAVKGEER